ncbi:MAG: 2-amino-4-hydroxy-6-hydroxymethyldihydropteridine diphosphokinase [Actinobacteria bacterium]|nr:2-amino-4-hydroxy-6-hydroxymethyldihydropteridine diphosphokinase [Actinomycetota bacterium]
MSDQIVISGIRGIGHHGVFEHERADGQEFSVDVCLDVSTTTAAGTDDLDDTVHYGLVANAVHALIVGEPVDLIETLAERVADACLSFPGVSRVAVTVHKPPVDDLAAVDGIEITAVSAVFETAPVGGPDQEAYLNAVVIGRTVLDDISLLAATQLVEQGWHRVREVRWGPRTLDVDILAIDDEVIATEDLVVPHPRAHERGFVLVPWIDVDPEAVISGRGRVDDLLAAVDLTGVWPASVVLLIPDRGGAH